MAYRAEVSLSGFLSLQNGCAFDHKKTKNGGLTLATKLGRRNSLQETISIVNFLIKALQILKLVLVLLKRYFCGQLMNVRVVDKALFFLIKRLGKIRIAVN